MPRVQIGMIGRVLFAIVIFGMVPGAVQAAASCSVSATGSLTPSSSGSVSLRVTNAGDALLQWVYIYKPDSASPFTGGSADGWSVASSDESRMEFTGGSIDPLAGTSYSLEITAGADSGSLGFDVQASESSDGSNRVECGSTSVDIVESPSGTPTPTSSSTTTTVTTVITATPGPTVRPTPTPVPDRTGPTIRITTDISKPFATSPEIEGTIRDVNGIRSVSYSVDGGKNYIPVDALTGATIKTFVFTPQVTLDDNYRIVVRGVDGAGNVSTFSAGTLIIDRMPPRIGAHMTSLGSLVVQEDQGIIPLAVGIPYRLTVSVIGGPTSVTLNMANESSESALIKNNDTGLWQGELSVRQKGSTSYTLTAIDGAGHMVVSAPYPIAGMSSGFIRKDGGEPLSGVDVVVYVKNIHGAFVRWDAREFGQREREVSDNAGVYARVLSEGTYYVVYKKNGFVTVRSRIFTITTPIVLSASVSMRQAIGLRIGPWFIPWMHYTMDTTELQLERGVGETVATISSALVGRQLPFVSFVYNGKPYSYLNLRGKSADVVFLTSWSPVAEDQLRVLEQISEPDVHLLGVISQQSDAFVALYSARGSYHTTLVADPDGVASQAMDVSGVPLHVFLDSKGIVRRVSSGFMSGEDIKTALVGR